MKQQDYTMRVLMAEDGYQLTQAADVAVQERMFTDKVYLSATDSPASWREIPAAEAEAIQAQQQALAESARQAEADRGAAELPK